MLSERLSLLSEANDGSSFSFPTQASTFAAKSDWLYHSIFWISFAFFAVIIVLMVYFVVKYRRREGERAEPSPSHNTWMEITWTLVPTVLLVWMFYEGALGFLNLRNPPADAIEIQVRAKQWSWAFTYPNGETYDTLHLAVNQPFKFRMRSDDVLHSFFIPEFRQKWDVVPGRYNETWVLPTRTSTSQAARSPASTTTEPSSAAAPNRPSSKQRTKRSRWCARSASPTSSSPGCPWWVATGASSAGPAPCSPACRFSAASFPISWSAWCTLYSRPSMPIPTMSCSG